MVGDREFLDPGVAEAVRSTVQFRLEKPEVQKNLIKMFQCNFVWRFFSRWNRRMKLNKYTRLYQTGGLVSRLKFMFPDDPKRKDKID